MNKLKKIIVFLLIIISLFSCSKEDNTTKNSDQINIESKWLVENSTEFKSLEFDTNGNYIITKNEITKTSKIKEEIFVTGKYEILDTDLYFLSDFGTVKFDDSDPDNIKFSIKYEGSNTYTYELNVTKAEDFISSLKTDLLCNHTWKFVAEKPIIDTISLINFSKAGTCFTNFKIMSQNSGVSAQFGKWQWKDNEETKIIITGLKGPQWMIDKDKDVEFEITTLNGVRLEMREIYNEKTFDVAFDTTTVKIGATKKIKFLP